MAVTRRIRGIGNMKEMLSKAEALLNRKVISAKDLGTLGLGGAVTMKALDWADTHEKASSGRVWVEPYEAERDGKKITISGHWRNAGQ